MLEVIENRAEESRKKDGKTKSPRLWGRGGANSMEKDLI
jgi:hypothetical protein